MQFGPWIMLWTNANPKSAVKKVPAATANGWWTMKESAARRARKAQSAPKTSQREL